ncbi:MAG TPA: hypothetical protein VFU07_04670 [Candidatus Lumbricidophila sp.]|nr:hypothetical protein [Candidatus Lumbricidophila sp.]
MSSAGLARFDALTSWRADWAGLRVAIVGLGASGFAAADTLAELGAQVSVWLAAPDPERARVLDVIGVDARFGEDATAILPDMMPELVLIAVDGLLEHRNVIGEVAEWANTAGLRVWSTIELAWRVRDKVRSADWITITTSDAAARGLRPSRTAELAEAMLVAGGQRALCTTEQYGVLDAVRDPVGFDALMVSLHPAELALLPRSGPGALHPIASTCLESGDAESTSERSNLDASLGRIYENTVIACVFNRADAGTMRMVEDADVHEGARAIGFGLSAPGPSDFGVVDGILCDRAFLDDRRSQALELVTLDELAPGGLSEPASIAEILAASALARATGVDVPSVHSVLINWAPG